MKIFLVILRIKTHYVIYWEGDGKNLYRGLEHAKNVYGYIKAIYSKLKLK